MSLRLGACRKCNAAVRRHNASLTPLADAAAVLA
jgi:hypothetical protein